MEVRLSIDAKTVGELYPSSVPLGTIADFASTRNNSDSALLDRFRLQGTARHLLPKHRVASCLRAIRPNANFVEVHVNEVERFAKYRNLMVCASVWVCPVCASTISETRRRELGLALSFARSKGHTVLLETLTFSHHKGDALAVMLDKADTSRRSMLSGRSAASLALSVGYIGRITTMEVTYSVRHGWHPHWHSLVFLRADGCADSYVDWARSRWQHVTSAAGLSVNEHGYDAKATYGAVADYVTKWGHEPANEPWGTEAEMTKAHMKRGRLSASMTPFQLLDQADTLGEAASLYQEFAAAMRGRSQLRWTPQLRGYLHVDDERSDEDIAAGGGDLPTTLAGVIYRDHWRVIVANDARGELLRVVRSGGWTAAVEFMRDLGVDLA